MSEQLDIRAVFGDGSAALRRGDHGSAVMAFKRVVDAVPTMGEAWANLAHALLGLEKWDLAEQALREAARLMPGQDDLRNSHAELLTRLGRHAEAVAARRRLIAEGADPEPLRHALMDGQKRGGVAPELADFTQAVDASELAPSLVIACMPKSGSTFLKNVMVGLLEWRETTFAYTAMENEQELYLPAMVAAASEPVVVQQHFRATWPNIALLRAFGIRPVVLTRNIFDALVSMVDFYRQGAVRNSLLAPGFPKLSEAEGRRAVIDAWAYWYVSFHASWRRAMANGEIDAIALRYEDLMADKPTVIARLLRELGTSSTGNRVGAHDIARTMAAVEGDRSGNRFNVGRVGRGIQVLSADEQDYIRGLAAHFPDVDFGPVGLG